MFTTTKVLFILTSQAVMTPTTQPTGVWFEELATPYYVLQDAGVQVDVVSVQGGEVPIDPRSVKKEQDKNPSSVNRFMQDPAAMAKIKSTLSVDEIKADHYDAVFLPGGHGTMWDFPHSKGLAEVIAAAWSADKVVAAVCHGGAGLVNVVDGAGKPIVAGRRLTSFSNAEETGAEKIVPFLLETRLRELGAEYESGAKFKPYSVQDGNLITGQNPASSQEVAELILKAIKAK